MPPSPPNPPSSSRRRALVIFINSAVALIGGGLTTLLAAFVARPPAGDPADRWLRAGSTAGLTPGVPVPRVLSVPSTDGWYRERTRATVFLVWDGDRAVRAMSATCTHLGCQVRWTAADKKFRCPCHGGVFDASGEVLEGPPPRPLASIDARIDESDGSVLVRV
jgi:Rieske Fe-S protein